MKIFLPKVLEVKGDPFLWIAPRWTMAKGVRPTLTFWGKCHIGMFSICVMGMSAGLISLLPIRWLTIAMAAGIAINADGAWLIFKRFRMQWMLCPASFAEWRACFNDIPATQEVHLTLEWLQICEEATNDFAKFRAAQNETRRQDAAPAPDREGLGEV